VEFEWDEEKTRANQRKHDIDFAEATSVFDDRHERTLFDPAHFGAENRDISLGCDDGGSPVVVSFTERGVRIRSIGASKANRREWQIHEKRSAQEAGQWRRRRTAASL